MSLETMFRERTELVKKRDDLDFDLKEAKKKLATFDESLDLEYINEGVDSVKVKDLGTLSRSVTIRASIPKERKEELMLKFKEHYPDLVVESVNAQTLSAFVRDAKKSGTEIAGGILEELNIFEQPGFRWTRSK